MSHGSPIPVAVTELEFEKAKDLFLGTSADGLLCFKAPAAEPALAAAILERGARHAILGVEKYAGALYDALPRGGVLARFGVGYDGLDLERAAARGLLCTNTPGVLDQSVAEHALALMLLAARRLAETVRATRAGDWAPALGAELAGKRLAVIGCGPIGCRVARLAAGGFGMRVTGCEIRDVDAAALRREFGFERIVRGFEDAAAEADFVSLHIPAHAATRHFMDAPRLARLKSGAWLVNTARGSIVDEAALFDALAAGLLAGAALDVFEHEPYRPVDSARDLRRLPGVIMTPHIGSSTAEACRRVGERALRNILLAREGRLAEMDLLGRAPPRA